MLKNSLLNALVENAKQNYTSFHMPGHKGMGSLANFNEMFKRHGFSLDVTELPGLDNLQNPTGILKELEEQIAKIFNSIESFMLINGATAGILAGILATTKPKQQILLPRNCHCAFWSALVLGDLEPIFVMPDFNHRYQLALPATLQDYKRGLSAARGANPRAAVIINPTYEGLVADIKQLVAWAKEQHILTIIDEAHGALFNLHKQLPTSGLEAEADLIIHGAHKTLGSLTQSGLAHLGTAEVAPHKFRQALRTVQSTSPSYLLMASLGEAVSGAHVETILELAEEARREIGRIGGITLVDEKVIKEQQVYDGDKTRLVLSPDGLKLSGVKLGELLREKYHIQVEMAQQSYIVAMLGAGTTKNHIDKLVYALKDICARYRADGITQGHIKRDPSGGSFYDALAKGVIKPKLMVSPRDSFYSEVTELPLKNALGEIAGEMICPYPPGIPLVYPGELITPELVEYLSDATSGMKDANKIKVLV